jgi:hypothetical protein
LREKSLYYFQKKIKNFKKPKKKPKKTFLVGFFRWVFWGFFGWVFLGGFFWVGFLMPTLLALNALTTQLDLMQN